MKKKVFVGLSGGVDSSVTAFLLKERGFDVVGVFMKNWSKDLPGFPCPWKEDYQDAKRVAVQLKIPFKMYDFEKQYKNKVVDYMVNEYKSGRTPNPDIMCNQEVKFKLFLDTAVSEGADMIATGHYARVDGGKLKTAKDAAKDQTYFLYRVNQKSLNRVLMPIGEFESKEKIRQIAHEQGLVTAKKKDSQGICFVGKVGIREFLEHELGPQQPGKVIDESGKTVGEHDGTIYYTIGQRHGLDIGGGLPYYVTGKDVKRNEVYVTTALNDDKLWRDQFTITDINWINKQPDLSMSYQVRTRYRAPRINCKLKKDGPTILTIKCDEDIRAITAGQSAVLYDGDQVLGGGVII